MAGLYDAIRTGNTAGPVSPVLAAIQAQTPTSEQADQQAISQSSALPRGLASAATSMLSGTQRYFGGPGAGAENAAEAAQWAPAIQSTDQVHSLSDASQYALGKIGGGLPYVPLAMAGGGLGRAAMGGAAGAEIGGAAALQPVMAGGEMQRMDADPAAAGMSEQQKFVRGNISGAAQSALNAAAPAMMVNRLGTRAAVSSLSHLPGAIAADTLKAAAVQGVAGAGSELVSQANRMNYDPNASLDLNEIKQAGIGSAIGMAPISGVHSAVAHGLDYANAGGAGALDLAKQGGAAVADMSGSEAVGSAVGKAASALRGLVPSGASDFIKHPELGELSQPQAMPPEQDASNLGAVSDWLDQDNARRNTLAAAVAKRTLDDPAATELDKQAAQAFADNSAAPDAWKTFLDANAANQRPDYVANKVGQAASWLSGLSEKTKGAIADRMSKSNLEPTADDDAFLSHMRDPIKKAAGIFDAPTIGKTADFLKDYVLNGFAAGKDGKPQVPDDLLAVLGPRLPEIVSQTYFALERQKRTTDIDDTAQKMLAAVKVQTENKLAAQTKASDIIQRNLALPMLKQVPAESLPDLADGIRNWLQNRDSMSAEHSDAIEEHLGQLFGPNKDTALEQLAALEPKRPAANYGEADANEASVKDAALSPDEAHSEDAGSDIATGDYENPLTEIAPAVNYHFGDKNNTPFDRALDHTPAHMQRVRDGLDSSQLATQTDPNTLKDEVRADTVGVVDHARATGDFSALDRLSEDHPGLKSSELNDRFKVLRTFDKAPNETDPISIAPHELLRPATKNKGAPNKASWQDVTKIGTKDVSTIADGRVYLKRADGTEFATSAQKLITKMWEKKTHGAFQGETAEKTGPADMLNMFAAGLSSLHDTGAFQGEMRIKMPDGETRAINGAKSLPDDFALYQGNGRKVTVGDAREAVKKNSGVRELKDSYVNKKPGEDGVRRYAESKKPADKLGFSDIPTATRHELLKAYHDADRALLQDEYARLQEGPLGLRSKKRMGEIEKTFGEDAWKLKNAKVLPDAAREGLKAKRDALEEEGSKRVDRTVDGKQIAPAANKETAGPIGERSVTRQDDGKLRGSRAEHHGLAESDEMSAAAVEEHANTERSFDEETGLELHPKEIMSADKRVKLLDSRVQELRGQYKALSDKLKALEAMPGKNAVREANIKAGHAQLDAIGDHGKKLAAERAGLAEKLNAMGSDPKFLKDTSEAKNEKTALASTDARAKGDIAYLAATIAHFHGEKPERGVYEAVTLHDNAALSEVAKAFGAKVRGFRVLGDKEKYGFFDGVFNSGNKDTVYLNDASSRPHMALLGHELVHQMRAVKPELYAKLEREIAQHIKPEEYKAWAKMFNTDGKLSDDALREEFVGEVMSDGMMDRSFWDALSKRNMPLAKQVYASVMRLLQKVMASVGYTPKTKSVLDDYAKVMKIAGEAMAEHGGKPGETLRAMNEATIKTPDGAKFSRGEDGELKPADKVEIQFIKNDLNSIKEYLKDPSNAVKVAAQKAVDAKEALDYHKGDPYGRGVESVLIRRLQEDLNQKLEDLMAAKPAVKLNSEPLGEEPITPEQKAEVSDYIDKVLGPNVAKEFTSQLKGSGEWSRDPKNQQATIRISTSALNPLSVASHEAMHEFFQRLADGKHEQATDVLTKMASSEIVTRQLERTFAGQDAVLKQIATDPSERVAYAFQLWASGKLKIGPQTETLFRKVINVMRKVIGLLSNDQKAEAILQSFHSGEMAEPSAMAKVLDTQEARGAYLKKVGGAIKPILDRSGEWAGFAENALTGSSNKALDWVGREMHNKVGNTGDKQGMLSARDQMNKVFGNKVAGALRGIDPTGKDKRTATKADVDAALEGLQKKEWHADPVVRRVQDGVVKALKEMYEYGAEAGVKRYDPATKTWVPMRKVDDYRIPVSWDPAKVIQNSKDFKALLFEHHADILDNIAKKANEEVASGKHAGAGTASYEKLMGNDKTDVTPENIADSIIQRLIGSDGQVEFKENDAALGFSPYMKSVNERSLDWIDHSKFSDFQEKDITKILSTYVSQITKRAEYSRRFGPDGGVLQSKMEEAWHHEIDAAMKDQYGVDGAVAKAMKAVGDSGKLEDELSKLAPGADGAKVSLDALKKLEPARRAIMAMEGTLGHDISPLARKLSSYAIVYQNVHLLGYSVFSNLIDPLGILVNGGEMKDAYAAFKRGMRDVVREWGDLTGLREAKASDRDEATHVAEMVGTVDSAGFMSQMGSLFGSSYLSKGAKSINDSFFRWNGTEALNRAMRIQATQAAISFIKRNFEAPNEHTERRFAELNLDKKDIAIDKDGRLNVDNRNVQQAIMRWVDGAVLRPNAAMRPTKASDPHYAVFYHLKQFMYAMHAVILKRAQVEIKNGNSDPLMTLLAGYVPIMIAADAAKGLLQSAMTGVAPTWEHTGVAGIVSHGVQRAGLLGIGQIPVDAANYGLPEVGGPTFEQLWRTMSQPIKESLASAVAVGPFNMLLKGANWDQ